MTTNTLPMFAAAMAAMHLTNHLPAHPGRGLLRIGISREISQLISHRSMGSPVEALRAVERVMPTISLRQTAVACACDYEQASDRFTIRVENTTREHLALGEDERWEVSGHADGADLNRHQLSGLAGAVGFDIYETYPATVLVPAVEAVEEGKSGTFPSVVPEILAALSGEVGFPRASRPLVAMAATNVVIERAWVSAGSMPEDFGELLDLVEGVDLVAATMDSTFSLGADGRISAHLARLDDRPAKYAADWSLGVRPEAVLLDSLSGLGPDQEWDGFDVLGVLLL